jgi:DNA modification methylase
MQLIHGDCLEVMHDIPDQSVDMVLADLPYGTTQCKWDTEIDLQALWVHYNRICTGPVVLFAQSPFDKKLGMSQIHRLKYEWIWEKTHPTGHLNAKKMPMKAHENLLVFYSKQPLYQPIKTTGHKRKTATKHKDETPVYGKQSFEAVTYDSTERYPRSVLEFPSDKQRLKLHPTQKPVDLLRYMIRTYTREGDTILDNVMGSGSTGVACLLEGRNFIGIEKQADYFSVAEGRLKQPLDLIA